MSKLAKNKALTGNISLVVLLAFLFTMTFGIAFVPQDAYAAYTYKTDQTIPGNDKGFKGTYTTTSEKVTVKLDPLSGVDFAVADIYLSISGTGSIGKMVYQGVYSNVYTWEYAGQMVYDQVYLLVYINGAVYGSIFLDVRDPVPDSGGGSAPTTPATTTNTETGAVTSTNTSSTLNVNTASVEADIAKSGVTEIKLAIPQDLAKAENTVAVPAATLQKAFEADKPVVVAAAGVELKLPVGAMDLKTMAQDGATVSIVITKVDPSKVDPSNSEASNTYNVLGNIFSIEIQVTKDGQSKGAIESFSQQLMLTLPYSGVDLKGVAEDRLSMSRYNTVTRRWDNLGGTIDKKNKVVTVPRSSLSMYALAERPLKSFADITGHWAKADIELMAGRGIVNGMSATTFAPDNMITRAEFATLVVRSLNLADDKQSAGRFKDVSASDWFAGMVGAAVKAGLVSGYEDGSFRPGSFITREEMAAVIAKAMALDSLTEQQITGQLSVFKDAGSISLWARAAVAGAVKQGVVRGRTDGTFDPKANATRAEGVIMLKHMLQSTGKL
ncbi:MAG: hypothetical protein VR68_14385 [Peptococcaceae bacterium BRH_c4a]|nr:MAG: hypothetical protein VR68_14385 [Peptococcaceae bacterium BRH_c4a]